MRQDGGFKEAKKSWVSGWIWGCSCLSAEVRALLETSVLGYLPSSQEARRLIESRENAFSVAYSFDPGAWY